jgi:hypothetical protein
MAGQVSYLPQARQLMADYPRWDVWVSLIGGQWHARIRGAVPPTMIHDDSPAGLREQIERIEQQ